jgi:hypothetical protein
LEIAFGAKQNNAENWLSFRGPRQLNENSIFAQLFEAMARQLDLHQHRMRRTDAHRNNAKLAKAYFSRALS